MKPTTLAQCLRKRKYNEPDAAKKIKKTLSKSGLQLYKYSCPECLFFHVTRHKFYYDTKNSTHQEDITKPEPKVELHNLPPKKREYMEDEDVQLSCQHCDAITGGIKYGEIGKPRYRCCRCMKIFKPQNVVLI